MMRAQSRASRMRASSTTAHLIRHSAARTMTSNYYSAGVQASGANNFKIWKTIAGSASSLTAASLTLAVSDVIKFELRGSTLKLYQNGTERLSVVNSELTATGSVGLGWGNVWI